MEYVINARYTYARKREEHVSGVLRNEGEFATVGILLNFRQKDQCVRINSQKYKDFKV